MNYFDYLHCGNWESSFDNEKCADIGTKGEYHQDKERDSFFFKERFSYYKVVKQVVTLRGSVFVKVKISGRY